MNLKQLKQAVQSNGGATLTSDLNTATINSGYMVSLAGYEIKTSLELLTSDTLENYKQLAKQQGAFIGLWMDNNDLYIDLSINIQEEEEDALKLAHENNQLAMYHIDKGVTIYV